MSRTRTLSAVAAAAVVAALAAGLFLNGHGDGSEELERTGGHAGEPTGAPQIVAEDVEPPAGYRFVGLGHAAVAVPAAWETNATVCGTPKKDTVVVDVGGIDACATPRPGGVESVAISQGEPRDGFRADRTLTIDGVEAQRQATTCKEDDFSKVSLCSGAVYVASEQALFVAESSTAAGEVDAILAAIRVLPDRVAVPGLSADQSEYQEKSQETYLAKLRGEGFRTEVRTELQRDMASGFVLRAEPAPGTMAHRGDLVTVIATGGADG